MANPIVENGRFSFSEKTEENLSEFLPEARQSALILMPITDFDFIGDFSAMSLEQVENGIRHLNELSAKCWLYRDIAIYSLLYDSGIYKKSGLSWKDYLKDAYKRLKMIPRDISESLSCARFFIKYHKELVAANWNPEGGRQKLKSALNALELSGDLPKVIEHLKNDTLSDWRRWYNSLKQGVLIEKGSELRGGNIEIRDGVVKIDNVDAVTVSDLLPPNQRKLVCSYIKKVFEVLRNGYEVAIVPVDESNDEIKLRRFYKNKKN